MRDLGERGERQREWRRRESLGHLWGGVQRAPAASARAGRAHERPYERIPSNSAGARYTTRRCGRSALLLFEHPDVVELVPLASASGRHRSRLPVGRHHVSLRGRDCA